MSNKRLKIILQLNKLNQHFYRLFATTDKDIDNLLSNESIKKDNVKNPILMSTVRQEIMKNLGLKHYKPNAKPRDYLLKFEPKLEDLPSRTMQDSFIQAMLPLRTNECLQRRYISQMGLRPRNGRLLEDMDLFACWICHKHLHIPKLDPKIPLPYTFVTILVDQVDFTSYYAKFNRDIRLSGHVSWVGRTSIETVVWLEQMDSNGVYQKITRALFLMAARNAINTKSAPVNPLEPGNDEELKIFNGGSKRKEDRIQVAKTSIFNVEPSIIEQQIVHDIFMKTINRNTLGIDSFFLPKNTSWMDSTKIIGNTPCYPEKLNVQNTVFGGYLMRIAIETSYMCVYKFCGCIPTLRHICDVSFRKPIYVKSFIHMKSEIVYTKDNKVVVLTICDALSYDETTVRGNEDKETTNIFECIFYTDENVKSVIPRTYKEAMCYLDGRRKFMKTFKLTDDDEQNC